MGVQTPIFNNSMLNLDPLEIHLPFFQVISCYDSFIWRFYYRFLLQFIAAKYYSLNNQKWNFADNVKLSQWNGRWRNGKTRNFSQKYTLINDGIQALILHRWLWVIFPFFESEFRAFFFRELLTTKDYFVFSLLIL